MTALAHLSTQQGARVIALAQRLMQTGTVPSGDWSRALKLASAEIARRSACN